MKKALVTIGLVTFLGMGCGTKETTTTLDEDLSFETAEMALEDISPEELLEESLDLLTSPPDLSPMSTDPSSIKILVRLNPNKLLIKGCRVPLLKVIEAQIHIGRYLITHTPSCAEILREGSCPASKIGDVCTTTFSSINCTVEISFPGGTTDLLTFTGTLTQSVEIKGINEFVDFVDNVTAVNLKVSSQNTGAYVVYNGSVSADLTRTVDGHKLVLSAENLFVEDSSGATGDINGTRIVDVVYGKSIKITNSGTVIYTSPEGKESVIELQTNKEISIDGTLKTITLSYSIITDGVERTREGTITIRKTVNEGDIVKEIEIDGEETITGPEGTFYVTIDGLVLDVNCLRNPRGGTITISNGDKEIKIIFKDSCSCEATIILPDGTEKSIDSCALRRRICK